MTKNKSIIKKMPTDLLEKQVEIVLPEGYMFNQPFIKNGNTLIFKTEKKVKKENQSFVKRVIVNCKSKE